MTPQVSDIDGTVTKSNVRGLILPALGLSDWKHKVNGGCTGAGKNYLTEEMLDFNKKPQNSLQRSVTSVAVML